MPTPMQFGLLGPLLVRSGGTELPVPRGHLRAILAALLLKANRDVPIEAIADTVWGESPPPSAEVTIRNHIRRLRKALGEPGRERISTRPRGYRISVADGELDLDRFAGLVASAQAAARDRSWNATVAQADQALALWRGQPLADTGSDALTLREVPRLAELRLQVLETRIEARLNLGYHSQVVADLQGLCAAHPLREHLHALLMLALRRSGRQAEALAAYQDVRRVLVEQLGADPGAELQKLHQQILTADRAELPAPALGATGGQAAEVPRQLPPAVARFTGRTAELQMLNQMLNQAGDSPGTVVISAIGGTAGVGKTALAIHWAHQVADRFPDGQLYADLRGFDPDGAPVTAAEVVRAFLDALGTPTQRIPPSPEARQGLYRSLLADRRMLIVLDNASDEQQVRPLIPATPGTLVLVTSRRQLTGLAAASSARLLSLDVLTEAEATQMLTARIGAGRAIADPGAAAEIARLCARLPLALAVTAARAHARPGFPLADLAGELRDISTRLDALDTGDPGSCVRAVFSWSCRQLTPDAARMFRLLGLHPGPDISGPAAASLAGHSRTEAGRLLAELTRAHLIAEHAPGRYAFHDLLRAYAADQAATTDSDADRHQAACRLLGHYLHTACSAMLLLSTRDPIALEPMRPGVTLESFTDRQQARAWFMAEHYVLRNAVSLAAATGFDACAWQLPWALVPFLDWQGHWHDLRDTQRIALAAAARTGDPAGQAVCLQRLGFACARLGDYDEAHTHLEACLDLYRQLGDRASEARAHQSLGWASEQQGRYADSLEHAEQAFALFEVVGHQAGQAEALNAVGFSHALLGNYHQARTLCRQALVMSRDIADRHGEALSWDSLGYTEHHLGQYAEAAACYGHAIGLYRELGDRYLEANTLTHLGDSCHASGDARRALDAWQQAHDILDDLQHPDTDQVRAKLAAAGARLPFGAARAG